MNILAIDTSGTSASIALLDDGRVMAELSACAPGAHAVWLMPSLDALLKKTGLSVSDIGLFAVTNGPGSFTGLRIGLSAVKGLAWATGKKVVAVSSLKALAYNARGSSLPVCVVLDARKGEVCSALYSFEKDSERVIIAPSAQTPDKLIQVLNTSLGQEGRAVFLGSGLSVYGRIIKDVFKGAVFAEEHDWNIRASTVAHIALNALSSGEKPLSSAELCPVYLRRQEAEYKTKAQ